MVLPVPEGSCAPGDRSPVSVALVRNGGTGAWFQPDKSAGPVPARLIVLPESEGVRTCARGVPMIV